ncbi:MAG: MBOAT family protein, partial [Candidatus Eremiobacteraeota bacterium]|nr:MBOAT family protein [Candidatus Eremiobacteraeota bacterium]
MVFASDEFLLFLPLVFVLHWWLRSARGQNLCLLIASFVFYGWWDWRFCALLFTSSFLAWLGGHLLHADRGETYRKWVVAVLAGALLALLGFFKYFEFFLESLRTLFFRLGIERDLPLVEIILPVGISFFIFQSISYLVDCYRREFDEKTSLSDVLLYVSFFPQLVAGPIVRASDFIPQLSRTPRISKADFCFGGVLIVIGLAKKMIVAHYLATLLVDDVFLDPASHSSGMLLLAVYGYAVQIYCDFSGYSDMAIGFAALLGYRFPR